MRERIAMGLDRARELSTENGDDPHNAEVVEIHVGQLSSSKRRCVNALLQLRLTFRPHNLHGTPGTIRTAAGIRKKAPLLGNGNRLLGH
jgi:hypothetical protein